MIGEIVMVNELITLHHNTIVLLDRVEFNILISNLKGNDSRIGLANKVLKRTLNHEKKHTNPQMNIPVRVYELRKLFPNYAKEPPLWWKRMQ